MAGEARGRSQSNAGFRTINGVSLLMARFPKAQARSRSGNRTDAPSLVVADQPHSRICHGPAQQPLSEIPAQLWLCLHLPQLPLEARASQLNPGSPHPDLPRPDLPMAICEEQGRRTRIVTVNTPAAARGARVGMPVNSALALVPELVLEARSVLLEGSVLRQLASWAGQFTPAVSIHSGNALLLEIQGSLRLFNGLDALRATVAAGLKALGHQVRMACATTARAALWLARAGVERPVRNSLELRQVLAGIHVRHLGWPARTVQTLLQMGVTTVGDCVRLPREGFARRLGPQRQRELDQAFGRHPEPQQFHVPPARFSAELELPVESSDAPLLLEGFSQLFGQLKQALESRQASVRGVWCRLIHPDGQETRLRLGLQQAAGHSIAVGLLPGLLRLRLEARTLPAAVSSLALQASLEPGQLLTGTDLLGQCLQPDGGLHALLERLRARLGEPAVQGFALRAEHRPESAWRAVRDPLAEAGASDPLMAVRSRPVWLLTAPELLGMVAGRPAWHGVLSLLCGPERIESGWWDGGDVRRDYYRASNPRGAMLWVYQDLRSQAWYLQGVFG
ncbi:MAG: DNA polymerase Y family protein [Chromatiales bacterium]|nr:MAG: DNA polymerase Y family protein [Chromatiales bacterium]